MAQQLSTKSADPKVILDLKVNSAEAIAAIISAKEQMAALKEEQKQLEAEMRKGGGTKEMKERLVLLKTEMRDLNTVVKANERELNETVKSYKQQGDSVNALRAKLKLMRQEYEDMSKAERDSAKGQELVKHIQDLTVEIRGYEQSQMDFRSSVGSYAKLFDTTSESMQSFGSVLASIFGQNSIIGKAATVVTGFGKSISDMSKNITDMASTASQSSKSVADLGTSITNTASSVTGMNDAMDKTTTVVQGFGAAERAAADAAKGMATNSGAAATATSQTAAASTAATTATTGLAGGFKAAATAAGTLAKQLLKLLANPYVALFAAIVAVLMKLVDAFKKNDVAMTELQSAMNAFRPVLDLINKAFQALVGVVTKVVSAIGNVVKAITNAIPFLREYAKQEEDLVRSADALEDAEREYAINSAKRQSQISELRNKSVESEKYSYSERRKFLEDAMELEKQDVAERKANAEEAVRIAEQKALNEIGYTKMTAEAWEMLSDEQKNHITELRVNVESLSGEFADATRRMTTQLNSFDKEEKAAAKQRAKAAADAAKERKRIELEAYRSLEDTYVKSIKDTQARAEAELKNSYGRQVEDLKEKLKTEKNLSENARRFINQRIVLLEAELQEKLIDLREQFSDSEKKKELERQKEWYSTLLNSVRGEAKDSVEIELVKINNKALTKALDETLTAVQKAKEAVSSDLKSLTDEEIMLKYSMDRDGLKNLEAYYIREEEATALHVKQMKEQIARQEQLAVTRITREGMNAREALAQEHATLLNEIETAKGLETYYYNEVEKTRILQEQAQKRLEIAQQNLQTLEGYSKEEQIAIYGTQEAYQNALLQAQLDVVNGENAVAEAARNTTAAIAAQKDQMIETFKTISGSISSVLDSFQSIFDTLAESDEKYKKYSTALAMMNILVSTAVSIANAIQGATAAAAATGPGAPIATPVFIAEMVAIVAGAIASATATLKKAQSSAPAKPKFATGGPVDRSVSGGMIGTKTTKRKDDTIDAKLSLGEYVIKSEIVKKYGIGFFDELNETRRRKPELPMRFAGGGTVPSLTTINQMTTAIDYSEMGEVFRDAVSDIQPVVSVQEINSMQTRVTVKEATASYN